MVKRLAQQMSEQDLKDFARTKTKDLPEHKEASTSSMGNKLQQLHHARESSDSGLMQHKSTVLGHMMRKDPQDWEVDSNARGAFPGITHIPTGYRFHAPRTTIPRQLLDMQKEAGIGGMLMGAGRRMLNPVLERMGMKPTFRQLLQARRGMTLNTPATRARGGQLMPQMEGAAGHYNPANKSVVVGNGYTPERSRSILRHELMHGYQDALGSQSNNPLWRLAGGNETPWNYAAKELHARMGQYRNPIKALDDMGKPYTANYYDNWATRNGVNSKGVTPWRTMQAARTGMYVAPAVGLGAMGVAGAANLPQQPAAPQPGQMPMQQPQETSPAPNYYAQLLDMYKTSTNRLAKMLLSGNLSNKAKTLLQKQVPLRQQATFYPQSFMERYRPNSASALKPVGMREADRLEAVKTLTSGRHPAKPWETAIPAGFTGEEVASGSGAGKFLFRGGENVGVGEKFYTQHPDVAGNYALKRRSDIPYDQRTGLDTTRTGNLLRAYDPAGAIMRTQGSGGLNGPAIPDLSTWLAHNPSYRLPGNKNILDRYNATASNYEDVFVGGRAPKVVGTYNARQTRMPNGMPGMAVSDVSGIPFRAAIQPSANNTGWGERIKKWFTGAQTP